MPHQQRTPDNWFRSYLNSVADHPWIALAMIALITLLLAWHLPRLSFRTTVYDLIIEDLPQARDYEAFRTIFGSDEMIRLVIKARDIFDPATFAKVTRMSHQTRQINGVRRVLSLPEIKAGVDAGGKWPVARFAELLAPVKLLQRNLISEDHRTTIITLVLEKEADKTAVVQAVETLIADAGQDLALYQSGMPLVSEALAEYTQKDFFYLTPITMLVIAALLLAFFRNLQCVLLPLACVALAILWTFGLMAWTGIPVSMLTIIVPVFLIAVGTAYCLHICADYLEQPRGDAVEATHHTTLRVAFPVTLAVLTTMIGIGSLGVNPITAIREFASFACFGLLSLLVIVLTFFPAVLALLPLPQKATSRAGMLDTLIDRLLAWLVSLNLKYRKPILLAIIGIGILGLAGMFLIRVETNPVAYFRPGTPVSRHFHDIYHDMSGSFPINVTVASSMKDYFEIPSNLAHVARLQEFLDQQPGVDKTVSLADYLMLVNYVTNDYNPKFYALPQDPYEMRYLLNNFKMLLGNDLLQRFLSADFSKVNILMLTHIASSSDFLATREAILDHAAAHPEPGLHVQVTGLGMVIAASSHLLTTGQVKSLAVSLVLIFIVMVALFLSSKVGLIALLPNIFPIVINFGLMGWLGIPLSVATSLIAGVAIGLAVDDTIHYLVRYNSEFKKDLDKDRAMRDTVFHVGRPIILTSVTIGLGFAVLIFSHFQPTAIFGLLMMITMAAALVGDLMLLPLLMTHVELVTAWDLLKTIPMVGRISPGMVHELNQPLNAIKVGSDFLKIMVKRGTAISPQQLAVVSREIGEQVSRASGIIQRFSELVQSKEPMEGPLQVSAPIRETVDILKNQIRLDNIDLVVELVEPLPPITALHGRMAQVIYHVLQNAWEAIVAKKRTAAEGNEDHCITIRAWEAKERLMITVADTGTGIAEHHLDRIFEPFFTTKATGQGKGLGLTVVWQIVREWKGRVEVESRLGKGTTVVLSFPVRA